MSDEQPEHPPTTESGPHEDEEAFDAIACILRVFGQCGFDTVRTPAESAEADLEAWARHVLVGSPPPGAATNAVASGHRNWKGLCHHVSEKRKDEVEYVLRTGSDLRAALWSFIQGMARAVPADRNSNTRLSQQLDKLRSSLDSNESGEIRRLAAESIDVIDTEIRQRIERDRNRIEAISDSVRKISDELTAAREDLERDALTGLYTRDAFDAYANRASQLGMLSGRSHTFLLADVDDFEWVEDRWGRKTAETVLKEVSQELRAGFGRRSDFVARYGDDEIAVLFLSEGESVDRQMGEDAIQRVRDLTIPNDDDEIRVTLSVGAARLRCGESCDEWLARADAALEAAKDAGSDRIVYAPDATEESS